MLCLIGLAPNSSIPRFETHTLLLVSKLNRLLLAEIRSLRAEIRSIRAEIRSIRTAALHSEFLAYR